MPGEDATPRAYTHRVTDVRRFRWRRAVAVGLVAIGALGMGRVAWVGYGPVESDERLAAQVAFLNSSISGGGDLDMQRLFPEGRFFTRALTGSAMANTSGAGSTNDLETLRSHRDVLDSAAVTGVFGSGMIPEHGIFHAGWALAVANDVARRTQAEVDRSDVRRRGAIIDRALRGSSTGFLAGYPGQYWPCDSVVAAAALADAAGLVNEPSWLTTVADWRLQVQAHLDPATGLLPHRVAASGQLLEGTRGSSQSIIQAFWPVIALALDDQTDQATWTRFVDQFVVSRLGLVGVREYPRGQGGPGDVDSGPLVLGVSASASAVTLAAARQVGDATLADVLDREAELLGLGFTWSGARRYALGQVPVGDAFLAWARSRPVGPALGREAGGAWWPGFLGLAALPGVGGLAVWPRRSPSRRQF
jgi:hypothetical protein